MKKSNIKNLLRGNSCKDCKNLLVSISERTRYEKYWKEEMPSNWCNFRKEEPNIKVCKNFEKIPSHEELQEIADSEMLEEFHFV